MSSEPAIPEEPTVDEILCFCISRQVRDGDVVVQGLATPLVAAAYLLARATHAPNLYFASAIGQTLCRKGVPLGLADVERLWLDQALHVFGFVQVVADLLPRARPVEFFRPAQIDPHGNFNTIAIGRDPRRPRLRLPGAAGIPDVTPISPRVYLYVPRHSRVTFVEQVDVVTGVGHRAGRVTEGGPCYLVTDLGQFDFAAGRLRLTHLHPWATLERVQARTGFPLEVAPDLQTTALPSQTELRLLRERIDPYGLRRLEFLRGPERRRHLRRVLEAERAAKS